MATQYNIKTSITFKGVELEVEYNYTPAWQGVWRYADGSGQPPEPAEVVLHHVWFRKNMTTSIDMWELLEDQLEQIEELLVELEEGREPDF